MDGEIMPFPVEHLIKSQGNLVCVKKDDLLSFAFQLMNENDFSQLPVIDEESHPIGMVNFERILQGIRHFRISLDDLHVRDVMFEPPIFNLEDDIFDLLDQLKRTNAVLIIDPGDYLTGIVTSYDSTEYFRNRTENLMRIEEIESILKNLIIQSYTSSDGILGEEDLKNAIKTTCTFSEKDGTNNGSSFNSLSLGEYIRLFFYKDTWNYFEKTLLIPKESLRNLLDDIRKTRNDLAHFRNDITMEQINQLHFCSEWLSKRQEEWDEERQEEQNRKIIEEFEKIGGHTLLNTPDTNWTIGNNDKDALKTIEDDLNLQEFGPKDSRYSPLSDYLLSLPGKIDIFKISFDEIEKIIEGDLPISARNYRAWWANDPDNHTHSKAWLDSGWRTSYINMSEKNLTFVRIQEREKLYIKFFSTLLSQISKNEDFPTKNVSPDGASWMIVTNLPKNGPSFASLNFSFTRDKQFRVELYIDLLNQEKNKKVFDELFSSKEKYEKSLGVINWERLDNKRASRIALYHQGQILDSKENLAGLQKWAIQNMILLYQIISDDVVEIIEKNK